MYGLIGRIQATPGKRDVLAEILIEGSREMQGCLSYVVARDPADADGLWVTEVWDSRSSHEASLALPQVRRAVEAGRPLVVSFTQRHETEPLGGYGLP